MTDAASAPSRRRRFDNSALTRKRYRAERNFRLLGLASVLAAAAILLLLLGTIVSNGIGAFRQHYVSLDVHFDAAVIDPAGNRVPAEMADANYNKLVVNILKARFSDVKTRGDRRKVKNIVTPNAPFILRDMVLANPDLVGTTQRMWFKMSDDMDMFAKGHIKRETKAADRQINDKEVGWFDSLSAEGAIQARFNTDFFTSGDSREPEEAGIMGAVVGSLLTMVVTLLLAFPIGVMAAVYLEEFAPRNRWTDLIEVNINNLAAVPSIVFGLLGLAMFLNFFRSTALGALGRRHGAGVDDLADHHHRLTLGAEGGAAVDPSGRAGHGGLAAANRHPSCPAPGDAGYFDRDHHRHGASSG